MPRRLHPLPVLLPVLLLLLLVLAACAVRIGPLHESPTPTAPATPSAPPEPALLPPRMCADARPPKLFVAVECEAGVCGFTCAPDRWLAPTPPAPPLPTPLPAPPLCCPTPTPTPPPAPKPAPKKKRAAPASVK